MNDNNSWENLPATKKQIKFLTAMATDSFRNLSRGEASKMIKDWLGMKDDQGIHSYNPDTLEENK